LEVDVLNIKVFYHEAELEKKEIIEFLYEHLEQYRDTEEQIENAIDYALNNAQGMGGFVVCGYQNEELVGCVVINDTAMEGYIPQHILVYIAVHKDHRGKGHGKELMNKVVELCSGNIALHVEYDNPAKIMYTRLGFKSKYAEMRYEQKNEKERQNEMKRRIVIRYKKNEEKLKPALEWITGLKIEDLNKTKEGFKKHLNDLVLWATDWNEIFDDDENWFTKFVSSFSMLINLPYEHQSLLNRVQKEFYHAIERVMESEEWEYIWNEFAILIKASKEAKAEILNEKI
jgi:ribosomal protein S18 acetylase RimI-like enzyme